MSNIILMTLPELAQQIANQAKSKRLAQNLSQKSLSERCGVSISSLKLFEHSGKISLESLLKIALVLDSLEEFTALFKNNSIDTARSLDELLKNNTRKRGRK